ncbi:MAG: HAD family hydrolase [Marinifilaceae bacterium]
MKKELVIFDLDGTLINSLGDIAASLNYVLEKRGLQTFALDDYRYLVGNGIRTLVERALQGTDYTDELVEEIRREFVAYYLEHSMVYTEPYAGVYELLSVLADKGVKMAIASNKFHEGTCQLVKHYFPEVSFVAVLGQREGIPSKPHRAMVDEIVSHTGVDRDAVLYVGDSDVDMFTACNSEVFGVGVTWGFRTPEELTGAGASAIINSPLELCALVD